MPRGSLTWHPNVLTPAERVAAVANAIAAHRVSFGEVFLVPVRDGGLMPARLNPRGSQDLGVFGCVLTIEVQDAQGRWKYYARRGRWWLWRVSRRRDGAAPIMQRYPDQLTHIKEDDDGY